jgi:hypothetical protein
VPLKFTRSTPQKPGDWGNLTAEIYLATGVLAPAEFSGQALIATWANPADPHFPPPPRQGKKFGRIAQRIYYKVKVDCDDNVSASLSAEEIPLEGAVHPHPLIDVSIDDPYPPFKEE